VPSRERGKPAIRAHVGLTGTGGPNQRCGVPGSATERHPLITFAVLKRKLTSSNVTSPRPPGAQGNGGPRRRHVISVSSFKKSPLSLVSSIPVKRSVMLVTHIAPIGDRRTLSVHEEVNVINHPRAKYQRGLVLHEDSTRMH